MFSKYSRALSRATTSSAPAQQDNPSGSTPSIYARLPRTAGIVLAVGSPTHSSRSLLVDINIGFCFDCDLVVIEGYNDVLDTYVRRLKKTVNKQIQLSPGQLK